MLKHLAHGIPSKNDYETLIESGEFKEIEEFSDRFLSDTAPYLEDYNNQWVKDPLHQWSRQWEYLYTIDSISNIVDKSKKERSVLDLGSGITFLPFYLSSKLENISVVCADYDETLIDQFNAVADHYKSKTELKMADMRDMPFDDNSFDVVYSVSVLEHTDSYEKIVKEIARILKNEGHLVVTFDISIDGFDDISMERTGQLLDVLCKYFRMTEPLSTQMIEESILTKDIVTSNYLAKQNKKLMPWKYPFINAVRPILKLKGVGHPYKRLTFCCLTMTKK